MSAKADDAARVRELYAIIRETARAGNALYASLRRALWRMRQASHTA